MKSDVKPVDKSRLAVKNSGLQRSSSDAGKDNQNGTGTGEQRKPPSGLVRPSAGGNFGFKKPPTTTSNGANLSSTPSAASTCISSMPSSAVAVGKIPKTSGIPVKPCAGAGGRKTSLDVSSSDQSGFLSPTARTSLQYRSLPRPSKTNTLTLTRPSSARPVSTTMDTGTGLTKPPATASQGSRLKEPSSSGLGSGKTGGRGIPSPSPVNQTDREKEKERAKAKAVVSDSECGTGPLKGSPAQTPSENGGKLHGLRPPSSGKCMDLTSPGMQRYWNSHLQLDMHSKSLTDICFNIMFAFLQVVWGPQPGKAFIHGPTGQVELQQPGCRGSGWPASKDSSLLQAPRALWLRRKLTQLLSGPKSCTFTQCELLSLLF